MKEIKGYALVGALSALIIYLVAPTILGNRIEIIENNQITSKQNDSNSYSQVFKKVNESVVSIYTRKSATRNNIIFIDPRE